MSIIRQPSVSETRRTIGLGNGSRETGEAMLSTPTTGAAPDGFCGNCDELTARVQALEGELSIGSRRLEEQRERLQSEMDEAKRAAYAEGMTKGKELAHVELAQIRETLVKVVRVLQEEQGSWKRHLDEEAADLIYEATLKIVGAAIAPEKSRVALILSRVLEQRGDGALTVRVAPTDRAQVNEALSERGLNVVIVGDAALLPGSCVVKNEVGELDARLDHEFENFKRLLLAVANGAPV